MFRLRFVCVSVLLLLTMMPNVLSTKTQLEQTCVTGPCGPNIDELIYSVVPLLGYNHELDSIKNNQLDMIPDIGSIRVAENLSVNSNLRVYRSPAGSFNFGALFFNCRRAPFDDVLFRTAFSNLINRKYVTDVLLDGWAESWTTLVPPVSDEWTNLNASVPGFSFRNATRIFDQAGYTLDGQSGKRVDPRNQKLLRQIAILTATRAENPDLWAIGEMIAYYANAAGIQTTHATLTEDQFLTATMRDRNFDMTLVDVALAAAPFGLYALFDSSRDMNWTLAYSGIHDLVLDRALETLWTATTKTEALSGARDSQARLAYLLPYVPIYSIPNLSAVSSDWTGVANMRGYGAANPWTYVSLTKAGGGFGGKFIQSIHGSFTTLNPILANPAQDWRLLELLYSPLFYVDPITSHDLPVIAKEWMTDTWTDSSGRKGMRISFYLRDDVKWQDGLPFAANDVKFTIEYLQSNKVPQYSTAWSNLVRVEAPNSTTVQIYLNATGYRYVYNFAWMTFLPQHIWSAVKDYKSFRPWEEPNPTVSGLTKLVGQGPFIFLQADLKKYARLVWNPLYFWKNPGKPSLLERQPGSLTATSGETINVKYKILNHAGDPVSNATAQLTVRGGSTIVDLPVTYTNGFYSVKVDTGKIGPGEYTCELNAAPYGLDTFTIEVTQSSFFFIFPAVAVAIAVAVAGVYLAMKRASSSKRTASN